MPQDSGTGGRVARTVQERWKRRNSRRWSGARFARIDAMVTDTIGIGVGMVTDRLSLPRARLSTALTTDADLDLSIGFRRVAPHTDW